MSDYPPHGPEKTKYINDLAKRVFARMRQEDAEKKAQDDNQGESGSGSGSGATSSGTNTTLTASTPATEIGEEEVLEAKDTGKENEQPADDGKSSNGSIQERNAEWAASRSSNPSGDKAR